MWGECSLIDLLIATDWAKVLIFGSVGVPVWLAKNNLQTGNSIKWQIHSKDRTIQGKARRFLTAAIRWAETGNWDFAIQMYLDGVRREPGNIERGHAPLRDVSLKRKMQGGKPAGFMEAMKHKGGKNPAETLANAEFLLAKDPGNVSHMVAVLKSAAISTARKS